MITLRTGLTQFIILICLVHKTLILRGMMGIALGNDEIANVSLMKFNNSYCKIG